MSATSKLNEKNKKKCFQAAEAAGFKALEAHCLRGPVAEVVVEGHRNILVDYKTGAYLGVALTLNEEQAIQREAAISNWVKAGASPEEAEQMALKMFPDFKA